MNLKKTLLQREKELQTLLANPAGRIELQRLAASYSAASGRVRPERASIVTFILVHERLSGIIHS